MKKKERTDIKICTKLLHNICNIVTISFLRKLTACAD